MMFVVIAVVVVVVGDNSICGILFLDRFAGRLTLSLRLTQAKSLDSHDSNIRHRVELDVRVVSLA